jgi:hypothetical protein
MTCPPTRERISRRAIVDTFLAALVALLSASVWYVTLVMVMG